MVSDQHMRQGRKGGRQEGRKGREEGRKRREEVRKEGQEQDPPSSYPVPSSVALSSLLFSVPMDGNQ